MPERTTPKAYEFAETTDGRLILALEAVSGAPDEPVLLLDRVEGIAILRRHADSQVILDHLHPNTMPKLLSASNIEVTELSGDDVAHSYDCPVSLVEKRG